VDKGHEFDEKKIVDRCRDDLAKFKMPQRIIVLGEFPKSSVRWAQKEFCKR
jgi:acyl-CoA synthetase (AMP-forming)/AMP-acid ligase II